MRLAALDIGSDSTRMLVADVSEGRVAAVERRSTITGLAAGVERSRRLDPDARRRVLAAVAEYVECARGHGSHQIEALLTSAAREAADGPAFAGELAERHGIAARIASADEEARLAFEGATSARPLQRSTVVVDIGGGSTELTVGGPGGISFSASTPLGVVRQTERHLRHDPPRADELEALRAEAATAIELVVPAAVRASVEHGLAIAAIESWRPDLAGADERARVLRLPQLEEGLRMLTGQSLDSRRANPGLDADRAGTIVTGGVILVETMHAFDLSHITLSDADLLDGALLRLAHSQQSS